MRHLPSFRGRQECTVNELYGLFDELRISAKKGIKTDYGEVTLMSWDYGDVTLMSLQTSRRIKELKGSVPFILYISWD